MTDDQLYALALEAAQNAYAPYSGFRVGAALLSTDGRLFFGANVENASYGATICAERSALVQAVFSGARQFEAIAVAAVNADGEAVDAPPCGICRQALLEFNDGSMRVLFGTAQALQCVPLSELLPYGFR